MMTSRFPAFPTVSAADFEHHTDTAMAAEAMALYCRRNLDRVRGVYTSGAANRGAIKRLVRRAQSGAAQSALSDAIVRKLDEILTNLPVETELSVRRSCAIPLVHAAMEHLLGIRLSEASFEEAIFQGRPAMLSDTPPPAALQAWQKMAPLLEQVDRAVTNREFREGALLHALTTGGENLPNETVVASAVVLVLGASAMASGFSSCLRAALIDPNVRELLRDPAMQASAIEELLRLQPPILRVARHVPEDSSPGELAFETANLVAANRDPAVFRDPDSFDPSRCPNPHLSFGVGRHTCDGAQMSRLMLRIAIPTMLSRLRGLRIVRDGDNSVLSVAFAALD